MHSTLSIRAARAKSWLMGSTLLAGCLTAGAVVTPALAQGAGPESIVVTGFRQSLQSSTNAKRNSTNFTDSIFAEDIGKFPDQTLAEAALRIPGIQISRENNGEGVNISIRGLGTSFTKILLNGAAIWTASTGSTDSQNANREVDLNMFPTELFSQLTVSKTSTADQVEGGASGVVSMRSARPFDKEGPRLTYSYQNSDYSNANKNGYHGTLIASDTWGPFGALVGVTTVHSNVMTTGWGRRQRRLDHAAVVQRGSVRRRPPANTCDQIGGNGIAPPATVPVGVTAFGLVPGTTIDQAFLVAHNPGPRHREPDDDAPQQRFDPRLGRSMYERGTRDKVNAVASFELRPSDSLHFYVDLIGGHAKNDLDRSDLDLGARAGAGAQALIPINLQIDRNNVVTSGSYANAQFFLEARPYKEKSNFWSVNPGMTWEVTPMLKFDLAANLSRRQLLPRLADDLHRHASADRCGGRADRYPARRRRDGDDQEHGQ